MPEVEVKDHPEDLCTFELHNPAGAPGYPITLVAHKDPVKRYWLKEIREYASDQVALAEHAADDLQLSEVPETGEEAKGRAKPEGTRIEPPKSAQESTKRKTETAKPAASKPEPAKPPNPKPVDKPEPAKPEPAKSEPAKPEPAKPEPAKSEPPNPKPVDKPEPAKPEPTKPVDKPEVPKTTAVPTETKTAEKRRESLTKVEDSGVKKTKTVEETEMSGNYSASRYSASSKVVEGEYINTQGYFTHTLLAKIEIQLQFRILCDGIKI